MVTNAAKAPKVARVTFDPNDPETWPYLLTPCQASKILGVSHTKAYAMVRRGELPGHKFGKNVRIPRTPFKAMIDSWGGDKVAGE